MNTPEHYKPVIVLDAGKVLVDFDTNVVLDELSKRSGREIDLPSPLDLDRLFFPVIVGRQSPSDTLKVLNTTLGLSLDLQEWRELWCRRDEEGAH
jgi:hypothetical protein